MQNALLRSPLSNEILDLICAHTNKSTLAALARTSQQVSAMALHLLWWELESVGMLRHAMPSDAYTVSSAHDRDYDPLISLTRDLTSSEIARVKKYTILVRMFNIEDGPEPVIMNPRFDGSAWPILLKYLGPRDFPRLYSVNLTQYIFIGKDPPLDKDNHISRLHSLIGSRLRRLEICLIYTPMYDSTHDYGTPVYITEQESERPNVATPMLLAFNNPHLKLYDFHMEITTPHPKFAEEVSNGICHLHHLSVCRLPLFPPIKPHAIRHLATLLFLQELDFSVSQADYEDGFESHFALGHVFPVLRNLSIRVDGPSCGVDGLIRSIQSEYLRRIYICIADHVPGDSISDISGALANHPSRRCLTELELQLGVDEREDLYKPPAPTCFSLLSSFPALEKIKISGNSFGGLDDDTVQALARGCPNLRKVQLMPVRRSHDGWSYASFFALELLLACCPLLVDLSVPLNIDSIDVLMALQRAETDPFRRPRLPEIGVGPLPILRTNDIYSVATLLSLWVPNLSGIYYDNTLSSGREFGVLDECWGTVWALHRRFKLIREQEHQWRLSQGKEA